MISLGNLYAYLDEQAELERKVRKQSRFHQIWLPGRKRKPDNENDAWLRQHNQPANEPSRQFCPQNQLECCSRGIA